MADIWVLPRKEFLSEHGCIWEGELAGQGWNEKEVKRPGRIAAFYRVPGSPDGSWFTVDWQDGFHNTGLIARDEVRRVNEDGSQYNWERPVEDKNG